MIRTASLTAFATAGLFLLPFAAAAEDSFELTDAPPKATDTPVYRNEITAGTMWQSNPSAYFGRYTGMQDHGWYAIGGINLHYGDAWDSGDTGYADLVGTNLGLDSRSIAGRFGQQGTWGITFGYDEIPYYQSNSFHTVFTPGTGALIGGVAPGSVSNTTTQLTGRLQITDVDLLRSIYTVGGKYQVGDWTVSVGIRHEHKDGLKENSLAWVTNPGMPINTTTGKVLTGAAVTSAALSYFAEPVDYDMDRYDITAQYNGERLQAMIAYVLNNYTDNLTSWNGTNPFLFTTNNLTGSTANAASVSALTSSRYSLPPSNSAHQIKGQLGYNVTPTTRINVNLQYGLMFQNDGYPSISGNPVIVGGHGYPGLMNTNNVHNPSSLDGAIQTVFAQFVVTSHPLAGLDLKAAYTLDDRESLTGQNRYSFYLNDGVNPTNIGLGSARNLRLNNTVNRLALEASYRILPETKVLVGYNFSTSHRTDTLSGNVSESSIGARVRSHLLEDLFGTISYQHSDRWAGDYNRFATFNAWNIQYSAVPTASFLPYYGLYDYFLSSRIRDEFKVTADWSPFEALSVSVVARLNHDFYPQSAEGLGLQNNNNFIIGPDLTYQITPTLGLHAFYEFQQIFFNQNSLVNSGAKPTSPSSPQTYPCNQNGGSLTPIPGAGCIQNGMWNLRTTDVSQTAGVSLTWQVLDDLKLSADYNFAYGNTNYAFADGGILFLTGPASAANPPNANLMISPLPNVQAMLNSLTLRAEYKWRPNITLIGGYTIERFSYRDYAYNVGATQIPNALMSGDSRPNDLVQIVGGAVSVRW